MTSSFIVPLDTREDSLEVVGGKGRSLARLANAGFDVPGGFQVTAAAYRRYVADNDLQDKILERVRPTILNGTVSFEQASLGIGTLFAERTMSAQMLAEITAAYDALADRPAVAVRSSANAEDLPDLSFAGQQETYLNVRGGEQVAEAVKKCWASLWTAQAINYRHEMAIDNKVVAMAVVVQVMVDSEVSGIAFTANPVTGERSEMIVNCSFGLGEAVVGGQVTPDTYVVDRSSLKATQTVIGAKEQMIVADGDAGTRMVDVDAAERATASLSAESLRELSALAIQVEATFGGVPQDVEWAVAAGKLWLLQSRPITNLPSQPPTDVSWPEIPGSQLIKRMAAEVMPEPLSPLFEDLYLRALFDTQTWPAGWEFNGSSTRNYLKNFVIATVNGYAYTSIPVDGNEEWEAHMAELRSEQGHVPWYKTLLAAFRPTGTVIEKEGKPGKLFLLLDLKGGRRNWIWAVMKWSRMFRRSAGIPRWKKVDLPAYLAELERWRVFTPTEMTNRQLLEGIHSLNVAEARYWHVLRRIIGAAKGTDMALQTFLEQNAPGEGFASGTFLSGFKSKVVDAEMAMRAIAEQIRGNTLLYELTIATPASRLLDAHRSHPEANDVVEAIETYLDDYGKQVFNLDFAEPALVEAPLPFIKSLKALVRDSGFDLATRQRDVARRRRAKWIQALKFFKGRKRIAFLRLYWTARINYPTREAAMFFMGAAWSLLRPFARELGQRLVDLDTLGAPDDIYYLTGDELQLAVDNATAGSASSKGRVKAMAELVDQVALRRALREQRRRMVPPPAVPPQNTLQWADDASTFDTVKINPDSTDVMRGFAVSPGAVTGVASFVMSPDDFDRMRPDSMLVCPLTTPAWTQLFPHATGLVADIGSITAHGSIVAREYGIPAVLGTGNGTQLVKDGQTIAVDGDKGTVTLL